MKGQNNYIKVTGIKLKLDFKTQTNMLGFAGNRNQIL